MTWVPNELEGFDFILVEFLGRLSEPRGWLVKLWECVGHQSLLLVTDADQWDQARLQTYIGKW